MARKTTLDDDSELYQKRGHDTEKQELKDLTFKEKLQYFKDYYAKPLIATIAIGGLVLWILITILSPKPETILYTAIINDSISVDKTDALAKEFKDYLSIEEEKEIVSIDASFFINDHDISQATLASEQKITTYMSADQIDVIITDATQFKQYAQNDYFVNLEDYLPSDLYSRFTDSFFTSSSAELAEENPYGIYLTDCDKYNELGEFIEEPILGIVINSKYKENAIEFIRFMYQ